MTRNSLEKQASPPAGQVPEGFFWHAGGRQKTRGQVQNLLAMVKKRSDRYLAAEEEDLF